MYQWLFLSVILLAIFVFFLAAWLVPRIITSSRQIPFPFWVDEDAGGPCNIYYVPGYDLMGGYQEPSLTLDYGVLSSLDPVIQDATSAYCVYPDQVAASLQTRICAGTGSCTAVDGSKVPVGSTEQYYKSCTVTPCADILSHVCAGSACLMSPSGSSNLFALSYNSQGLMRILDRSSNSVYTLGNGLYQISTCGEPMSAGSGRWVSSSIGSQSSGTPDASEFCWILFPSILYCESGRASGGNCSSGSPIRLSPMLLYVEPDMLARFPGEVGFSTQENLQYIASRGAMCMISTQNNLLALAQLRDLLSKDGAVGVTSCLGQSVYPSVQV